MKSSLVLITCLVSLFCSALASAANKVSSNRITIDEPITDEFTAEMRAHKSWPTTEVEIQKTAGDAVLVTLTKLPEILNVDIKQNNDQITSLEPLAKLPNLAKLDIFAIKLPEGKSLSLAPLGRCKNLMWLRIGGTRCEDVEALAQCTKLVHLNLQVTREPSLAWLSGMSSLQYLNISAGGDGETQGFAALGQLHNLIELRIADFKGITHDDVNSLASLRRLRKFDVYSCKFLTNNVNFMRDMADLEEVELINARELTDLSGLANKQYLHSLKFDRTGFMNLSPLASCVRLSKLHISSTPATDYSPLSRLPMLQDLRIYRCPEFKDLSFLGDVRTIKKINFFDVGVEDLSPLVRAVSVERIRLQQSAVTDISPLAHLPDLIDLELSEVDVTDLSPLYGHASLVNLELPKGKFTKEQIYELRLKMPLTKIYE